MNASTGKIEKGGRAIAARPPWGLPGTADYSVVPAGSGACGFSAACSFAFAACIEYGGMAHSVKRPGKQDKKFLVGVVDDALGESETANLGASVFGPSTLATRSSI